MSRKLSRYLPCILLKEVRRTKGEYTKTINKPVFPFSIQPGPSLETQHKSRWNDFFLRQLRDRSRPSFVLHDGPPYANGDLHIGHALNKILKDVLIRHKLCEGYRVKFVPGWDCHGLPIELKAINQELTSSSQLIRSLARDVASEFIDKQKLSFMDWGIIGDWNNYYTTMDNLYTANELRAFAQLYSKGLVYRDVLPVHWSGESKTALAESELEYNSLHISTSVYLSVKLASLGRLSCHNELVDKNLYCVVWTTTPWTIPSNEAIVFDPCAKYTIAASRKTKIAYLVGHQFTAYLSSMLSESLTTIVSELPGDDLTECTYHHPFGCHSKLRADPMPFVPGTYVVDTKGTGLVPCAPCHGREDFELGLRFSLPLNQIVDEEARFTSSAGPNLAGLSVLTEGSDKVMQLISPMVIHQCQTTHSYPYDWRTKSPVITRLSHQWFLDTSLLNSALLTAYNTIRVRPASHNSSMLPFLINRPRWCISRQRVWGVPIPVLILSATCAPIVDLDFIEHIAARVDECGCDFWFDEPLERLVPGQFWTKWSIDPKEVTKSTDVFDVWFDSGLSWFSVLQDEKNAKEYAKADVYLEGLDQLRGWFSSSLILGVALAGQAPYRELIVHGFTTDSDGRKMSKSLGNVVSPKELLVEQRGCVDVLRRWAACSGLENSCSISHKQVKEHAAHYKMLRNSFRFMLGNLSDFDAVEQLSNSHNGLDKDSIVNTSQLVFHLASSVLQSNHQENQCLRPFDRAALCWLGMLVDAAVDVYYPNFWFNKLFAHVDQLIDRLSSVYHNSIKDILYCDLVNSRRRRGVQTVLWLTSECLNSLLVPLLPFLGEEIESSLRPSATYTLLERCSRSTISSIFGKDIEGIESQSDWTVCLQAMHQWRNFVQESLAVELADSLQRTVTNALQTTDPSMKTLNSLQIHLSIPPTSEQLISALQLLHPSGCLLDSESDLCHMFRTASIAWSIQRGASDCNVSPNSGVVNIGVSIPLTWNDLDVVVSSQPLSGIQRCPRCNRYKRPVDAVSPVCLRCADALSAKL